MSSIAIATVNGNPYTGQDLHVGDKLKFNYTIGEKLAGWEYPMIAVAAFQDVNQDGTVSDDITGPDVVYTELDNPDAEFTLGGYSSIWTERGGGAATVLCNLDAYGWKAKKESIRTLASTGDLTAS